MSSASPFSVPARPTKKKHSKYRTWEHPVGSRIKIAEMPNKTGGRVYGVSYQVRIPAELLGVPGKREMHQCGTKLLAERYAEDRFLALKAYGTEFAKMPAYAQKQAAMAWHILNEHNERQRNAAREKNGGQLPSGLAKHELNLIEAVKAGIRALAPIGGLRTFAEVSAELRASKLARLNAGGLDPSTESDFRRRSERLDATLGSQFVSCLTVEDLEKTLKGLHKTLGQRSILNFRNTLSEILRHAKAKQYSPTNPIESFTKEDFKSLGGENAIRNLDDINILTVKEARRLLNAARKQGETGMLATLVLRLFCGLRSGEVSRLEWQEVHWLDAKPYVHIPAGKAKKRRIRQVEIPANALEWLKLCNPPTEGRIDPLSPKTYSKRFGRISREAGIGSEDKEGKWESAWEINDTRHSFGSYHYALHGDSMLTAKLMGHKQTDDVLFAHYRQLVTKEAAQEFFGIAPPPEAGNVEEFPRAATA